MYRYEEKLRKFFEQNHQELVDLMVTICQIPAPSNQEEKRAAFCKQWLEKIGAKNVTIDKALNVIYPMNCEGSNEIVAVMAHSDTVFPDLEPMPLRICSGCTSICASNATSSTSCTSAWPTGRPSPARATQSKPCRTASSNTLSGTESERMCSGREQGGKIPAAAISIAASNGTWAGVAGSIVYPCGNCIFVVGMWRSRQSQ